LSYIDLVGFVLSVAMSLTIMVALQESYAAVGMVFRNTSFRDPPHSQMGF
jgi:hypothetical protein